MDAADAALVRAVAGVLVGADFAGVAVRKVDGNAGAPDGGGLQAARGAVG
ncbi:MAG: hypothetical protein RL385_159 [Pseudomonadota bacterium]|jgi:hypothetical protein